MAADLAPSAQSAKGSCTGTCPFPRARVWLVACPATFVFQPRLSICVWSDSFRCTGSHTMSPNMARETVAGAREVVSLAGRLRNNPDGKR